MPSFMGHTYYFCEKYIFVRGAIWSQQSTEVITLTTQCLCSSDFLIDKDVLISLHLFGVISSVKAEFVQMWGVFQKAVSISKALRFFWIRPFVYFADLNLQLQNFSPHAVAIGTHGRPLTSVCFGSESRVEGGGVRELAWDEGCDMECFETWTVKKRAGLEMFVFIDFPGAGGRSQGHSVTFTEHKKLISCCP